MADGNSAFAYKMFMFSLVLLVTLPMMIGAFVPAALSEEENDLLDDYYDFTGNSRTMTKEAVWVLTGIYTPYENAGYNYTEDGWLYGQRVYAYTPEQYQDSPTEFRVKYDGGYYRYAENSADYTDGTDGLGHAKDDLYTSVVFDKAHRSNIFFSEQAKYTRDGSKYVDGSDQPFYFQYTGWRYAFQPTSNYELTDADGKTIKVVNTTTSLSLVWYYYYTQSGISGQLILSGSDGGQAYLSSDQIIKAFDSTTSTARFDMTFNQGVQMGIYIRIDPSYLAQEGKSVKDAYDNGYWSIMVTSKTTDSSAYSGTDYDLNIWNLFEITVDLMTFNYSDYQMSSMMGAICSFIIVIPLYAGLIALALGSWPAMAAVGIMAAVNAIVAAINNITSWWPF